MKNKELIKLIAQAAYLNPFSEDRIKIDEKITGDSKNKSHAQFTNLIAQPDAEDDLVKVSVNNMLKAITASLLMEQVLAPNFKFKTKLSDDDKAKPGEIKIRSVTRRILTSR